MRRHILCSALLTSLILLQACGDYASQSDRIYHGAGYAMQQNLALQRDNRHASYGGATDILSEGKTAVNVMRRHNLGGRTAPASTPVEAGE